MDKDLIIDASSDSGVDIALLEDKKLVELHRSKSESQHIVGDIYLGQVKRILPGLNAAFVDVGYEKDGFLHYLDLGLYYSSIKRFTKMGISNSLNNVDLKSLKEPNLGKNGLITDYVKQGQLILVQISKEPISTKGPRLSAEISFAGRFLVSL